MKSRIEESVWDALRTVNDPEIHKDLVSLEMVKRVSVDSNGVGRIHVELTTPACPLKSKIASDVEAAVRTVAGITDVQIEFSARVRSGIPQQNAIPGVKNVVAVGAGKGGVGKSTVAAIVSLGLQKKGATVGLLDADVYGPSIPTIFGVTDRKPKLDPSQRIHPIVVDGVKIMSVGFLIEPEEAVIWRGPMIHKLILQFLSQVAWGELDYLIVDLPPGTGDVSLTLTQAIPLTGAIVVCTPQELALNDARRAVKMYEKLNVGCLGIVENMSYYLCPACGNRDEIFDHGRVRAEAERLSVPYLGEIPLNVQIRRQTDAGAPSALFDSAESPLSRSLESFVTSTAGEISRRVFAKLPRVTLSTQKSL